MNNSLDILIVDDEPAMGELFTQHLSAQNVRIKAVSTVKDAIIIIKREKPKIAFIDLFLPELDGFDLAERIFEIAPDCQIVVMSGIYEFNEQHLKNLKIKHFIKKPIDFAQIDVILRNANVLV